MPAPGSPRVLRARARRDGDSVIVEGIQPMSTPNGDFDLEFRDVYAVSDDGALLTITTTRTNPDGTFLTRQVYKRK